MSGGRECGGGLRGMLSRRLRRLWGERSLMLVDALVLV
jgi:hypothetical protein